MDELVCHPESNIVCYRLVKEEASNEELNEINARVRREILLAGEYYIVQTVLNGRIFLRNTMMNPFTTEKEMRGLLDQIISLS